MDIIPKSSLLEFKPDTVEYIRKEYNFEKPGQMKEAVSILRDWVQKQNHFKKKDFSEHYFEITIVVCKGSVERAKRQLDKLYTLRTLLPQFFGAYNVKNDFKELNELAYTFLMPKLTDDHYRVEILKFFDGNLKSSHFMDYYRLVVIIGEFIKAHDYMDGFIIIVDFTEANLMEYVKKINPIDLKQAMTIFIEGYGLRIKGIHVITASKFVDALVAIIKQVVSPKVAGRIHVHKTVEEIQEHIPKSLLPKDYGGEERSLKEIHKDWIEALSSDEHMKYLQEMTKAGTDEAYRQTDTFNDMCAGMPGTFKLLSVD